MNRLVLLIVLYTLPFILPAQSTDKVKYYVLHDVSGSVKMSGSRSNLDFLSSRLLELDNETSTLEVSVEFIPFGEADKDLESVKVERYNEENLFANRDSLYQAFTTAATRSEQYTHLRAALEKINSNKEDDGFTSYGVFIMCDGQLQLGDVVGVNSQRGIDDYVSEIKDEIIKLNNQAKPVFFVQVSQEPKNNFHEFNTDKRKNIGNEVKIGDDLFWLQTSFDLEKRENIEVLRAFDKFIREAHNKIINLNNLKIEKDNESARLTLIADFLNLLKYDTVRYNRIKAALEDMNIELEEEVLGRELKVGSIYEFDPNDGTMIASTSSKIYNMEVVSIDVNQFFEELKSKLDLENLDESNLNDAKEYVKSLMQYDRLGELKGIYRDAFKADANKSDDTPILTSIQSVADSRNSQDLLEIPEQSKDRNLEESIVLGLSDYLIERTKQEAMFAFYENIYLNIFDKNTFLRDTLFYNFSSLIKPDYNEPQIFEPNLLLFKEAINEDFSQFPENLAKHPKIRSSPGGTTIYYTTKLISHLQRNNNLEEAFAVLVKERLKNIEETTPLERGFLFTAHLIEFLRHNNLPDAYNEIPDEQLTYLSELAAVWIASKYPDIREIKELRELTDKIKFIYQHYMTLRQVIKNINDELDILKPSSDFEGYRDHQRNLALKSIDATMKLLTSGLEVVSHYTNDEFGEVELSKIRAMKPQVEATINAWFYIKDKEYGRAAAALIPVVSEIPAVEKSLAQFDRLVDETSKKLLSRVDNNKLKQDLTALQAAITDRLGLLQNNSVMEFEGEDEIDAYLVKHHLVFLKPLTKTENVGDKYQLSLKHVDGVKIEEFIKKIKSELAPNDIIDKPYKNLKKLSELNKSLSNILKEWTDSIEITGDHLTDLKNSSMQVIVNYVLMVEMNDDLKKLTAIAGEVSTARTAGDVNKALWKYALPVASYRAKRKERSFILVNAYVGSGGVREYGVNENRFVLTAPIGLEVGGRSSKKENGSFSLFIPVLDVGNVINYQIKDEQQKTNGDERTFQLENLISPGIYIMFGMSKRFPLSIGAGWQANPNRVAVTIAFDLPLFRLK